MSNPRLLFVYNADSGLLNALKDALHKAVAPDSYPCSLCAITYGAVSMHSDWKRFQAAYAYPSVFLHRDEFKAAHPGRADRLPAVFLDRGEGEPSLLVGADAIDRATLPELDGLVRTALERQPGQAV